MCLAVHSILGQEIGSRSEAGATRGCPVAFLISTDLQLRGVSLAGVHLWLRGDGICHPRRGDKKGTTYPMCDWSIVGDKVMFSQ